MSDFIKGKLGKGVNSCHIKQSEVSQNSFVISSVAKYLKKRDSLLSVKAQNDKDFSPTTQNDKLFDEKDLNTQNCIPTKPLEFSIEAKAVFNAGRELWCYYHAQVFNDPQKPYNAKRQPYDIREYF